MRDIGGRLDRDGCIGTEVPTDGVGRTLAQGDPARVGAMDMNAKPMKPTSLIPSPGRRAAMRALAGGAALIAGQPWAQRDDSAARAPACVLTPRQTEGPYFVDERLERVDIRSDPSTGTARAGVPLALSMRISTIRGSRCEPLRGAIVDVWHCDAGGVYSDVDDPSLRTKGTAFLRGYQVSGANGQVRFMTIYPGAYRGRAVHIHFKVRTNDGRGVREFTSQLYFDDALTDHVHERPPYAGLRRTRNADDGLFRAGGRALILDAKPDGEGYAGAYDIGLRGA
jgi:protocatechuate 3,4-dioxygenase beta subunit